MQCIAADLHIHTVLSPCASREMTPPAIVREAQERGLRMIAVCDHNSAGNVAAVMEAAAQVPEGPSVICGMEITTVEEVHVLGYFPGIDEARAASAEVAAGLPPWRPLAPRTSPARTRPRAAAHGRCGERHVRGDAHARRGEQIQPRCRRGPHPPTRRTGRCRTHGPAEFSVPGQLGFLPPDVPFDGLEVSAAGVSGGTGPPSSPSTGFPFSARRTVISCRRSERV